MDIAELKAKIKTNKLNSFIVFIGDEWKVQEIYIDQIAKTKRLTKCRVESFAGIRRTLKSKSFVRSKSLYIIRDDKDFMQNEKLLSNLEAILGNNMLILTVTKLDKRTKFYNRYKSIIVEFEALPSQILRKYIQKQIQLSDTNCDTLIEVCESNYGRILLEIDKIKQYRIGYGKNKAQLMPEDGALLRLINGGTIYKPPKDAIFDLVEAILRRNVKQTFDLLEQSYAVGEATMVMLSVLFDNAKAVLQVQTCQSKEVSKSTGLTGWQIMNANKVRGHYTEEELIYMLHLIRKLETGIKTGKIEDKFVMDYLLTEIL